MRHGILLEHLGGKPGMLQPGPRAGKSTKSHQAQVLVGDVQGMDHRFVGHNEMNVDMKYTTLMFV